MGGSAGHMAHLHENIWLSFGEIKSFLSGVASAELSPIEKVDGQNIFFRWTPEGVRTARNMGDIKKGGMTIDEHKSKFAGHPAEAPFVQGLETIVKAMSAASQGDLQSAFDTGQPETYRFVNCEIMFPANPNMIIYDGNYIVLHNLKEYAPVGPGGKMSETEVFMPGDSEFDNLVQAVQSQEKSQDAEEWQIFGPQYVQLKNIADGTAYEKVVSAIDGMGYGDDQKLGDVVRDQLQDELSTSELSNETASKLIKRVIAIGEGTDTRGLEEMGLGITSIKKGQSKGQRSIIAQYGSQQKARSYVGKAVAPLAKAVSDFAIEVLRGLHSFFMTEGDTEVERMRTELDEAIAKLESYSGDNAEKYGEMLEAQLAKLGPIENIASTVEGLVFEYPPGSKQLVKLTGSFAMANQIVGKAKRIPNKPVSEELPETNESFSAQEIRKLFEAIEGQDFDSVAIIGGAFKPPHLGHLAMADHYARKADRVKIYISNPQSSTSKRFCGDVCLTADMALRLWEILLAGRTNIDVEISSAPSPITVAYDAVMPGHPWEPGTTVYLGASVKGGDIKRFSGAVTKADDNIEVPDPAVHAAPASRLPAGYKSKLEKASFYNEMPSVKKGLDVLEYSASDLRELLSRANDPLAKELAGYFVGTENVGLYAAAIYTGASINETKYNLVNAMFGNF